MTGDEAEPLTLLLVDDEPEHLVALEAILKDAGCRLLTASSGEQALEIALREKLAVILLDVVMPGMDGIEVARTLKQLERTREVPLLFLTGLATDLRQLYRADEVGAVDHLTRPLDAAVVRRKVGVFVDLARQRAQLERQASELQDVKEEARRAAHLREEFLAVVAHDLRSPLSSIRLGAGLLARVADGGAAVPVGKAAQTILRASERMERLISDLLDFALIQAGRLTVERQVIDADELIRESLQSFGPLAAEQEVRLEAGSGNGLKLEVDRDRLLQILSNLLGNAIKFTPEKGSVRLRLERSGAEALFVVSDTGRGMSADELSRMWGRSWQARRKPEGGLGLGLVIVKALVEAHGGRIWAESQPGVGTSFFFTMPLAASSSTG